MQLSFGRSASLSAAQKAAISQVSQWVLAHLLQSNAFLRREDAQLIVTEVQCSDPDCVPVETFVAVVVDERYEGVLAPLRLTAKVLKPVVEASEQDVQQLNLRLRFVDERIASAVSLVEDALGERESERERPPAVQLFARFLSARVRPNTQLSTQATEKITTSSQQSVSEAQPVARAITRVPMRATCAPSPSLSPSLSAPAVPPSPTMNVSERSILTSSAPTNTAHTSIAPANIATETTATPVLSAAHTDTTLQANTTTSTNTNTAQSGEPLSSSSSSTIMPQKRYFREVLQERKRNEEKVSVAARHSKEEKRRGCPCCDPDNLDHLLDKIMFMEYPPA